MTPGQWFKFICMMAYGAIVAGMTYYVHDRSGRGPFTVAVRQIEQNQLIADTDLRSVDRDQISGHYARRAFAIGDKITPDDVSKLLTLADASMVAAVVTMAKPSGPAPAIGTVQVCLDKKPLGKTAKVLASTCDDRKCMVTVPLGEWPKDVAVVDGAKRLSAVPAGEDCSGVPAAPVAPP